MEGVRGTPFCRFRMQLMLGCVASLCAAAARADVQLQSATPTKIAWSAVGDGLFCAPLDAAPDAGGMLTLNLCPQREASRGVKFEYAGVPAAFGGFDLRAGMAEQTTTGALTIEQLTDANAFARRNVALNAGATSRLFGDRLTLSSDFAWSRDEIRFGGAAFAAAERLGSGRWHKADLTLIDDAPVRWTATIETSSVDRDYAANFNAQPLGAVMLPGDRFAASTRLKLPDVTLALAGDRTDGPYGLQSAARFKAAFDGLTVSAATKRSAYALTYGGAVYANNSETASVSFEALPETLFPEFGEDADFAAPLIPTTLSLTYAQGTFDRNGAAGTRESLEMLADWTGDWGDTSVLFWRELKTQAAGESVAQMLDISHTVRWGRWRMEAGAFAFDSGDGNVLLTGSLGVAYEITGGPRIKLRVGQEHDRLSDEEFAYRRSASDIMLSVDLSETVRRELNEPSAYLKLDYRRKLDRSAETLTFDDWREQTVETAGADGLLIAFGTRF